MPTPKIIIPIQPNSVADAQRKLRQVEREADLVEIWLDGVKNLDTAKVRGIVKLVKKPLILNLKDKAEKGTFRGSANERLELLSAGAKTGAKFIDLPLDFSSKLIKKFRQENKRTKLIISWHDFAKMPDVKKLRSLAKKAEGLGADVIKLVGTAKKWSDNLPILQISHELAKSKKTFLAMAMGERGEMTRIITPLIGGMGMFAVLDKKNATAPGQLTVKELKRWWKDFS